MINYVIIEFYMPFKFYHHRILFKNLSILFILIIIISPIQFLSFQHNYLCHNMQYL